MDIYRLSKHIKTTTDQNDFLHTLDLVAESLYKSNETAEEVIQRALPYEQYTMLIQLAMAQGTNMANKASVRDFLYALQQTLKSVPVVQIDLAIQPKIKLISLIHEWFFRNYNKMVILDIKVKPHVIAGAVISYNGKYYDNSLGKASEEMLGGIQ